MKYQDFIPPIFARALKKPLVSKTGRSSPEIFLTYTEALEACFDAGYEDGELIEVIFEKTRLSKHQMLSGQFPLSDSNTQSLVAVLYTLQHVGRQKHIKVIDFGGACGAHYFQLRPFLSADVEIDWVVVETPAMVEKASALETKELRFCNSLLKAKEKLQGVDLLHSSGALQYVPDPQDTLQEFLTCQPTYLFLNRLALSTSEIVITVQESLLGANGPGALPESLHDRLCRYPVTYFPKHQLEEVLRENYQTKFSFAETRSQAGSKEIIVNTGMFLERLS